MEYGDEITMNIVIGIIVLIGIFAFGIVCVKGLGDATQAKLNEQTLVEKVKYDIQHLPITCDDKLQVSDTQYIGINKKDTKFVIYNYNSHPKYKIVNFKDIISSKIVQDGEIISQSSNVIGRAIVGGILAGGIGAAIGGLSGEKRNKQLVKKLVLDIVLNDLDNPSMEIMFFNNAKGVSNDDISLKEVQKNISRWHNLITVVINQNNKIQASK